MTRAITISPRVTAKLVPAIPLLLVAAGVHGTDLPLAAEVYAERRSRLIEMMPEQSVALFLSADRKVRSRDVEYQYRQSSDLLYLTGVNQPEIGLILLKESIDFDGRQSQEVFFVPVYSARVASYEGESLSKEEALGLGFKIVRTYDEVHKTILPLLADSEHLLLGSPGNTVLKDKVNDVQYSLAALRRKALQEHFPALKLGSIAGYLRNMRQIKSASEIELLKKAIDITCEAQREAARITAPERYEYELQAGIEYIFCVEGGDGPAFPSIVGSGPNSTVLHYSESKRQMQSGDLMVIDIGAEFRGYSADVARTFPVNGKFSSEQKEIYEIVLRAQKEAIDAVSPGVPFSEVHTIAKRVIDNAGYGRYFTHATSHYLGLDTHDVGDRTAKLQAGMVLTVEPGIYIAEGANLPRDYWNIGIRIEDDVLVTVDGHEVLSASVPREVHEVEVLMQQAPRWLKGME